MIEFDLSPKLGEVFIADFGQNNNHCIAGLRPCVILYRNRETVTVIPISKLTDATDGCQIIIQKGDGNLLLDSRLIMNQVTTIDIGQLQREPGRKGRLPIKVLFKIAKFFVREFLAPILYEMKLKRVVHGE